MKREYVYSDHECVSRKAPSFPPSAGFVSTSPDIGSAEDISNLVARVDRAKILSDGRSAVEKFLQKLYIYKMSADIGAARMMYDRYAEVHNEWAKKVRPVTSKMLPRKIYVQGNRIPWRRWC